MEEQHRSSQQAEGEEQHHSSLLAGGEEQSAGGEGDRSTALQKERWLQVIKGSCKVSDS